MLIKLLITLVLICAICGLLNSPDEVSKFQNNVALVGGASVLGMFITLFLMIWF